MTPIFPEVDPTTGALPAFTEARFLSAANGGLKAPLASPAFTGNPTAPTPTAGDNDTSLATTAFVTAAIAAALAGLTPTLIAKVPLALLPVAGVFAARPAWAGPVMFWAKGLDGVPAAKPAFTGSTGGGGGMVEFLDIWFQPAT